MHKNIPFSKVYLNGNELEYIREVLDSGWLTTASKAQAFEERFRERVGARFACAVNSFTAAMHLTDFHSMQKSENILWLTFPGRSGQR